MSLVYRSAVVSLVVQLLVGSITTVGFFVSDADLSIIFAFELASQVIELLWYVWVVCRYRRIVTWTRYVDWVWSTPVMHISTALFLYHRAHKPILDVLRAWPLYLACILNWLMLAFGFAMETGAVRPFLGLAGGGVAFVGSFGALAVLVDEQDALSVGLLTAIYIVWALYGVAAALPDVPKNVGYNALDVVSKNFYGLFLFVYSSSNV